MDHNLDTTELRQALAGVLPSAIADALTTALVPVFVGMIKRHAPEGGDEVNYDGIAASLDYEKLAGHIDNSELAGEIDLDSLADEIELNDLANAFDEDTLVNELKKVVVVDNIEPDLIEEYVKDRLRQDLTIEVKLGD